MLEKLGGRKAIFAIVGIVVGAITVALNGDVPANYLNLLQFIIGAFIGGNVLSKAALAVTVAKASKADAPPAAPAAVSLSTESTEAIEEARAHAAAANAKVDEIGRAVQTSNKALEYIINYINAANKK